MQTSKVFYPLLYSSGRKEEVLSQYHTGLWTKALGSKNKRISKILLEREKWSLRKLGLYRFKFAFAIVPDLNDSQLSQTQLEPSLWLTVLSKCSAVFSKIWGLLVRFQNFLEAFYRDPLWIFHSMEKWGWHHLRKKVMTSWYQMTLGMITEGGQRIYSRIAQEHTSWSLWNFAAVQGCQWSRWYKNHFKILGTMPKRCYLYLRSQTW